MMTLRHAVAGLLLYTVILPGSKHRWIQESRWAYLLFRLTVYCVLRLNGAPREQVIWQLQRLDELEEEGVTDDDDEALRNCPPGGEVETVAAAPR